MDCFWAFMFSFVFFNAFFLMQNLIAVKHGIQKISGITVFDTIEKTTYDSLLELEVSWFCEEYPPKYTALCRYLPGIVRCACPVFSVPGLFNWFNGRTHHKTNELERSSLCWSVYIFSFLALIKTIKKYELERYDCQSSSAYMLLRRFQNDFGVTTWSAWDLLCQLRLLFKM